MRRLLFQTIVSEVIDHLATGAMIRKERKRLGLTLKAAAAQLGFSVAYLSALERGKRRWSAELIDLWNRTF